MLVIQYSRHIGPEKMRRFLKTAEKVVGRLKPTAGIGFNVISRFHLPRVKMRTYPNLAEAVGSLPAKLLAESPAR